MKKGFTLIELLGVIVVLGIIGIITIPSIQNLLVQQKEKANLSQIATIEDAAKTYAKSNPFKIKTGNISICTLIQEGYLEDGDYQNPVTEKYYNKNSNSINLNTYKYTLSEIDTKESC